MPIIIFLNEKIQTIIMRKLGILLVTLSMLISCESGEQKKILKEANGHVKTAIVMILADIGAIDAKQRLKENGGFVRRALA